MLSFKEIISQINRRGVNHVALSAINLIFREGFIKFLPVNIQSKIASKGFPNLVSRNGIRYEGKIFGTNCTIKADSSFAIERFATSNVYTEEPFGGLKKLGLSNAVILDIGANVGTYSLGMAALGAKKVLAIEPGPYFAKLKENIKLNQMENIIFPIKIGFAKHSETLYWFEDMANKGNAHLLSKKDAINAEELGRKLSDMGVPVDVLPLDDFIAKEKIEALDLIKIDVEGMEWEVLSSGLVAIQKFKPIIVAETHKYAPTMMRYDCLTPMFETLYSLGYKSYSWNGKRFKEVLYPNITTDTFFIENCKRL